LIILSHIPITWAKVCATSGANLQMEDRVEYRNCP
jgi:hypothetical protein